MIRHKKILIALSIIILTSVIFVQQIQIYDLYTRISNKTVTEQSFKSYLLSNYGVSSIDELIQKRLKEYEVNYVGNPFVTALYQGQLQAENITGMHWYTYISGSLYNRTDVIAYPEQAASYVVFTDGTYFYAKNCSTGQIEFGGSWDAGGVDGANASAVIQAAVDNTPNGGKIDVKSDVELSSGLSIEARTDLTLKFFGYFHYNSVH